MYHQVEITPKDQFTHLFVWRHLKLSKDVKTYAMIKLNMGDKPAQSAAIGVLFKTADLRMKETPESSKTIKENSYSDDICDSLLNREEAETRMKEINDILELGGFHIKEWHVSGELSKADGSNVHMVLGCNWNKESDSLSVEFTLKFCKKRQSRENNEVPETHLNHWAPGTLTKRDMLSQLNSVYDPLGLVSPVTIKGKYILRQLWASELKLGWDASVSAEFEEVWSEFIDELFKLSGIKFLRCLKPKLASGNPTLVLFSDFGKFGFVAAAYIRWKLTSGKYEASLAMSKNRVAPLKTLTVPRGELCGAVLQARLRAFIVEHSRYRFQKIYHLTDSEIVRAYISNESSKFSTFVANRVAEIRNLTNDEGSEWYHLERKFNIADRPTKGMTPEEIGPGSEWQCGPLFLTDSEEQWPISKDVNIQLVDLPDFIQRVFTVNCDTRKPVIEFDRFSRYRQAIRVTARVLKIINARTPHRKGIRKWLQQMAGEVVSEDIDNAEMYWIKQAQKEIQDKFEAGDYMKLGARREGELIVVGTRTERWNQATWNQQLFYLLPGHHAFTQLFMKHSHMQSGHLGIAASVSMVRSRFWVVDAGKYMRRIVNDCVICKKRRAEVCEQIMSGLPIERLKPAPAFFRVGIDFFGPMTIRGEVQKRVRGKCFGVVITCFGTRAVYVDITTDYSTDQFLLLFRRFVSLRGYPGYVHSDGGPQLVAASKELKKVVLGLDWQVIKQFGSSDGLRWEFTPGDSPHRNGVTERMVQTVKKALNSIIGEHVLTFSELQTACFEASNLVNQRPIGAKPSTPDDGTYLCPNDNILGRASTKVPQGPFSESVRPCQRYEFVQKLINEFWKKWTTYYFPHLLIQNKWHTAKRNCKVNDIVLVKENTSLRGKWKLARISEVIPSDDGYVRTVKIAYKNLTDDDKYCGVKDTEVIRSVQKLVVLLPAEEHNVSSDLAARESSE